MELIVKLCMFVPAVIGMTLIVTQSEIFKKTRSFVKSKSEFFGKLLSCVQCSGTWCGWILGFVLDLPYWGLAGFAGSFLAMLGEALLSYLNYGVGIPLEINEETNSSRN